MIQKLKKPESLKAKIWIPNQNPKNPKSQKNEIPKNQNLERFKIQSPKMPKFSKSQNPKIQNSNKFKSRMVQNS